MLCFLLLILSVFFLFQWMKSNNKIYKNCANNNLQLKNLNQTILKSKTQLEAVFDAISDGIAILDKNLNIIRLNRTYAEFANTNITSILGNSCYKSLQNLDSPCPKCPITNIKYHDGYNCKIRNHKLQIEIIPRISGGVVQNYIEIIRNVEKFEALHAQLRRSERMATIGAMVAGIAHEMNNPLSGISGNAQLMIKFPQKYGLNTKGISRMETIMKSSERAIQIVKDMLSFSKPSRKKYQYMDFRYLLENALSEIKETDLKKIEYAYKFTVKTLYVWGNQRQLITVLSKIILNATQAIKERQKTFPELIGKIIFSGWVSGNNVVVNISDNGCGISEEKTAYIFDPFFTTKDPGSGIGMGLSMCHRIMEEHLGRINFERLEEGSMVQLFFPKEKQNI